MPVTIYWWFRKSDNEYVANEPYQPDPITQSAFASTTIPIDPKNPSYKYFWDGEPDGSSGTWIEVEQEEVA